jgi:hypothetical protein
MARKVFGATVLVALLCTAITAPRVLGVPPSVASLACAPVVVFAFLSWLFTLRGKPRSVTRSFITGAVSGLAGTLVWPTGFMIWDCIKNMNHLEMGEIIVMLIGILIVGAMVFGAAIATTLTLGFQTPIRPQGESSADRPRP